MPSAAGARREALAARLNARPQVRQMKARSERLSEGRAKVPAPAPVQKPGNRTGLSDALKGGIESLSGLSMDDVRVHYNSAKPAQLQALAYTQGNEIHIGPSQERHLPHEAWHVVQQKQGRVKPTVQMKGLPVNAELPLEREAEAMGSLSAQAPGPAAVPAATLSAPGSVFQLMSFFHGTTLTLATNLAGGTKVKPVGKGELGGGFYTTHKLEHAAHIAQYYRAQEKDDTKWGVVEFDVLDDELKKLSHAEYDREETLEYREKLDDNTKENPIDWSTGVIIDKQTPYPQHLFAGKSMGLLNDKESTKRKLALQGEIGKGEKSYKDVGYDIDEDEILQNLPAHSESDSEEEEEGEGEEESQEKEEQEEEEEEEEEDETPYLEGRVKQAVKAKALPLFKSVQKELDQSDLSEKKPETYARLCKQLKDAQ